jgi:hypothetical protein
MWPILEVKIGEALAVRTSANGAKDIGSASPPTIDFSLRTA